MQEQEIIEGNKLIDAFSPYGNADCPNCKYSRDCNWLQCSLTQEEKIEQLNYHKSWDWLMPVVEKIEMSTVYSLTQDYDEREEFKGWTVHWFTLNSRNEILGYIEDKRFETKIEAAWYAVVEFIKWYNKQEKL